MKTAKEKIARHFGFDARNVYYVRGQGWYVSTSGKKIREFIGKSFHDIQRSPKWARHQ